MSDLPYILTKELKTQLTALGWYEGRKVDISADLESVCHSGWVPFPLAITFAEQFDGLGNHLDYCLGFEVAGTDWEYKDSDHNFAELEAKHGSRIFPIGEWNNHVLLTIDEQGRIAKDMLEPLSQDAQSDFETLIDAMYRVHVSKHKRTGQ